MNMEEALNVAARKARRMTTREEFVYLDNLSRTRALTPEETTRLHRAIKIIDHPKAHKGGGKSGLPNTAWTSAKDTQLCALRRERKSFPPIAKIMGVTAPAAASRWHRLNDKGMA